MTKWWRSFRQERSEQEEEWAGGGVRRRVRHAEGVNHKWRWRRKARRISWGFYGFVDFQKYVVEIFRGVEVVPGACSRVPWLPPCFLLHLRVPNPSEAAFPSSTTICSLSPSYDHQFGNGCCKLCLLWASDIHYWVNHMIHAWKLHFIYFTAPKPPLVGLPQHAGGQPRP